VRAAVQALFKKVFKNLNFFKNRGRGRAQRRRLPLRGSRAMQRVAKKSSMISIIDY